MAALKDMGKGETFLQIQSLLEQEQSPQSLTLFDCVKNNTG